LVQENKTFDWQKFAFVHKDIEVDTSDWLTYRNEKYGWEIKYPKEWKVNHDDIPENISFVPINDNAYPFVGIEKYSKENADNLSVEEFRKQLGWSDWKYKIQLDDNKITGVSLNNIDDYNPHIIIDLVKEKYLFEIKWGVNFGEDKEAYKTFTDMLSTFHFYK